MPQQSILQLSCCVEEQKERDEEKKSNPKQTKTNKQKCFNWKISKNSLFQKWSSRFGWDRENFSSEEGSCWYSSKMPFS